MRNTEYNTDVWLPGDKENEHLGDERGTIVGDGTSYKITHATIEMVALDDEATKMIHDEEARLSRNSGSMNPIDQLPSVIGPQDDFEKRFLPGFPGTPRPVPLPKRT